MVGSFQRNVFGVEASSPVSSHFRNTFIRSGRCFVCAALRTSTISKSDLMRTFRNWSHQVIARWSMLDQISGMVDVKTVNPCDSGTSEDRLVWSEGIIVSRPPPANEIKVVCHKGLWLADFWEYDSLQ